MEYRLPKTLYIAIDKYNYQAISTYLKQLAPDNYRKTCNLIIDYVSKGRKKGDFFWELASLATSINLSLSNALLLRSNIKGINLFKKQYKKKFAAIFRLYCQKDNNINDIIMLMKCYSKLFDESFLNDILSVSVRLYKPNQFLLAIGITGITQKEAIEYLKNIRTLCSYFTLAYIVLDPEYNKKKNWKLLSKSEVFNIAKDLREENTRESKFTAEVMVDAFNHDYDNEAEGYVYEKRYGKYCSVFKDRYGFTGPMNVLEPSKQQRKKEQPIVKISPFTKKDFNYSEDFSISPINGIVTTILIFKNNKIALTDAFMGYAGGILYPSNVLYNERPLPIEDACTFISLYQQSGQNVGVNILRSLTINNRQYAVVSINIEAPYSKLEENDFVALKNKETYPIKVVSKTPNFVEIRIPTTKIKGFIRLKDFYGLSKDNTIDTYESKLVEKPSYINQPLIFENPLPKKLFVDKEEEKHNDFRYANLFKPMELENMRGQDKVLIDIMLSEYPTFGMSSDNSVVEQKIICRNTKEEYNNPNVQKLLKDNFWVSPRTLGANNVLFLFNQDSMIIKIIEDNNEFYLDLIADARQDLEAINILEKNKLTQLKISGANLAILNLYDSMPSDYNADGVFTYINRLNEYYKIKYDLGQKVIASKNAHASDFYNQSQYLNFQIYKERERTKFVKSYSPDKLKITSGESQGDSVALIIDMPEEDFVKLQGGNDEQDSLLNEIRVNTLDSEGKIKDHCVLKIDVNDNYVLHLLGEHKNAAEYISTGITLQGDANTKHLYVQRNAINDFVKKDQDSLYVDLLGADIKAPDISKVKDIEFYNSSLNDVEEGNSQPIAVKKAISLDYKGILLIQGPPGTGKTTTIVEIIRQLVNQKRKVLVCSQSHAAVGNIYDKLKQHCDNILRVDEHEEDDLTIDTRKFNSKDYEQFLRNNLVLFKRLKDSAYEKLTEEAYSDLTKGFYYSTPVIQEQYIKLHNLLIQYHNSHTNFTFERVSNLLEYLANEAKKISGTMLQTQVYQSKDVILGTCVGVGMNPVLKDGAIHFDTVIIDEAAKANLAESIVPMRMGDRYVLVGDDNQLPPYVDRSEIQEMLDDEKFSDNKKGVTVNEMVASQNKSLFEYFHNHKNFPQECLVTLNYQYRMNPAIGDFISNLFYEGKIHNGKGTEEQELFLPGFDNPVTVIDTSNAKGNEEERIGMSVRNKKEAEYICKDILPSIKSEFVNNPDLTLGIISPYASQCDYMRSLISERQLRNCVHTIDSIQGMEFDVVIFSFVRSFNEHSGKKVGFVDDMKRLNVSLSRAKKKLIVIGNMRTLTKPSAHYDDVSGRVKPIDVFKKLSEMPTKVSLVKTSIQKFLESGIKPNEIIENCSWNYSDKSDNIIKITFEYNNNKYTFNLKVRPLFFVDNKQGTSISLKYMGLGKDSKPYFGFKDAEDDLMYTKNEHQNLVDYNNFIRSHRIRSKVRGRITDSIDSYNYKTRYFVVVDGYECSFTFGTEKKFEIGSFHTFTYRTFDNKNKFIGLTYSEEDDYDEQ